jgi:hypothetical protein
MKKTMKNPPSVTLKINALAIVSHQSAAFRPYLKMLHKVMLKLHQKTMEIQERRAPNIHGKRDQKGM